LEIRYFTKEVPVPPEIITFDSSSINNLNIQETMEKIRSPIRTTIKPYDMKVEEEFWIRWYPDEIQYGNPIGMFTVEEKQKWARYEKLFMDCKSEREESLDIEKEEIDEEKIREELKELIKGYSTSVPQELREIIQQETSKGTQKINELNKRGEEIFGNLGNDLIQIVENKDDDSIKIAAINKKVDNTFKNLIAEVPSLIETSGNLNNFSNLAANAQNQLSTNLQNSFQRNLDVNTRINSLREYNLGFQAALKGKMIDLINADVNSLKSIKSANKIQELTEKLVDDAIISAQISDENKRAKRTELIQFLHSVEKTERTLYIDFVERLLAKDEKIDIKCEDNSMFVDVVKANADKMKDTFGITRARQLAKNMFLNEEGKTWDFDTDIVDVNGNVITDPLQLFLTEGIQINTLPNYIVLYTIKEGFYLDSTHPLFGGSNDQPRYVDGRYFKLGDPIEIKRDHIFIKPLEQNSSTWLTDFEKAVSLGMGIKITDQTQVEEIKNADWLIAVGFSESEEIHEHFEEIFKRRNAKGELSIVAQDSPTNNTEEEKSPYMPYPTDISDYFERTNTSVPSGIPYVGAIQELMNNYSDAQILTNIFKFDPSTLGEIEGADLHEENEATAMNMFLWDACMHKFKWLWEERLGNRNIDWKKFSMFCLENLRARGNFPVIRVGKNPYGILPVMALDRYVPIESIGEDASVLHFVFEFCRSLMKGGLLPQHFHSGIPRKKIPTIEDIVEDLEEDIERNGSYEHLLDILGTTRVSKELNVRIMDSEDVLRPENDPLPIACALIKDEIDLDAVFSEISSLISTTPSTITSMPKLKKYVTTGISYLYFLSQMNTPFSIDEFNKIRTNNPPVLKRIIYYLIEHINEIERIVPDLEIKSLASMLSLIDPNKLEILLMEFFDLFSHRIDAWVTSLAHERLIKYYKDSDGIKPNIGVYGWLEKPGKIISTPAFKPEYIQAPSQDQAVATALLRNASLLGETDDPDGSFRINLSSDQVKKGMEFFEGLRERHSPEELLGYQIERYIHDNKNNLPNLDELDIYKLRKAFPLRIQRGIQRFDNIDEEDNRTFVETVINGVEFIEAKLNPKNLQLRKVYSKNDITMKVEDLENVQDEVKKTSDAAADMAVAETVYQYSLGNMERVTGWLDWVDGKVQPPKPEFIKAHRTGDRHGTKTFIIVEPPPDIAETFNNPKALPTPRKTVAPIVDHFATSMLGSISKLCSVSVIVTASHEKNVFCMDCMHFTNETDNPNYCNIFQSTQSADLQRNCADYTSKFELENIPFSELQFESIDLLIGGISELELKIRYYIVQKWNESIAYKPFLGDYPWDLTPNELLNKFSIELSFDDNTSSIIEKARLLRKLLHQNIKNNLEVSSEPHEEFKIIREDNYQDIDLFKTIKILLTRTNSILTRFRDLYDYMADVFFNSMKLRIHYNLTRLKWSLENELDHINTHQLWTSIAKELDEIFQFDVKDNGGVSTLQLEDLLPEYLNEILALKMPAPSQEGITPESRPETSPPKGGTIPGGTTTPPPPDTGEKSEGPPPPSGTSTRSGGTPPPGPIQLEPVKFKKYIDWINDIINYEEETEYTEIFSGFMEKLDEIINGLSYESPDYDILRELLQEVSRYGYHQALTPFLGFESIKYENAQDVANLKIFNIILKNLVIFLRSRIITVINQINELTNKDLSSDVDWTENWLGELNELTNDDASSGGGWITDWLNELSQDFDEEVKKFCWWCGASIASDDEICGDCDQDLSSEDKPKKPFWKIQFRIIKGKLIIKKLISILQEATDGKKIMLFTPYVLSDSSSDMIKEWSLDLESLKYNTEGSLPTGGSDVGRDSPKWAQNLKPYATVRKKINDVLNLLKDNEFYDLYEDRYELPSVLDKNGWEEKEEEHLNSDYLYISPFAKSESITCFACVYIDDWAEFFPYMTETTGIAYRYDAPQSEAPNAILLAISPNPSETEGWTPQNPDLLAQTLLETIDLMKTRMISSNSMIYDTGLGKIFPALLFDSSNVGIGTPYHNALFPQQIAVLYDALYPGEIYPVTALFATSMIDFINTNENNIEE